MNVQLHRVISDISGTTGLHHSCHCRWEERDLHQLAALKDFRISVRMKSLLHLKVTRRELVFVLQQELHLTGLRHCRSDVQIAVFESVC